jgi:hypothetical protein
VPLFWGATTSSTSSSSSSLSHVSQFDPSSNQLTAAAATATAIENLLSHRRFTFQSKSSIQV